MLPDLLTVPCTLDAGHPTVPGVTAVARASPRGGHP